MADTCRLRQANGVPAPPCEERDCIYWRVAEHIGVAEAPEGCAIQHFELLDGGEAVAEWLLSVKERLEGGPPDS